MSNNTCSIECIESLEFIDKISIRIFNVEIPINIIIYIPSY